ncbi:MAG: hypothetical protein LBG18_09585 [Mediterranea sp.]|jgi:hypothetical protein|nr:hypothetical protein [Mediterranea sp.]
MKKIACLLCSPMIMALMSCEAGDGKSSQTIEFGELAPQNLMDGSLRLQATASSGLPVTFSCPDASIAVVKGDVVEFVSVGRTYIIAGQSGNESFHEAPNVVRELTVRNWDPAKKTQVITFELPDRRSNDDPPLLLVAVSTSGLPVKFTSSDWRATIAGNWLTLFHGTSTYDVYINITASQEGDEVYNPAENVVRTIHAIGDGTH